MHFVRSAWKRRSFEGTPVYVRPGDGDWFVPNAAGDRVLVDLQRAPETSLGPLERLFLARLPPGEAAPYAGRGETLRTDRLAELWLHVTQRCNQRCGHCLFDCQPGQGSQLPLEPTLDWSRQAAALGCTVFALTGGEPLLHPDFEALVDALLELPGAHVAVLTNGLLLPRHAAALRRWPHDRVHLQISVEGAQPVHDGLRGAGAFAHLQAALSTVRESGRAFTAAMAVGAGGAAQMDEAVATAAALGASNVHFLWHLLRGRGSTLDLGDRSALLGGLRSAWARAAALGVGLDNVEALRAQVFTPPGTRHDGGAAGWESLAIGPDGMLYPSAATVGLAALATPLGADLGMAWRSGAALERVRGRSVGADAGALRFLTGGGDPDQIWLADPHAGGPDPYAGLMEDVALWLLAQEADPETADAPPALRLERGEVLVRCASRGAVALTHSNCLLAVADGPDSRTVVGEFYTQAAHTPAEDILNPATYPEPLIEHVPLDARVRSYGCGSPVLDAALRPGERVVDLGSGAGVECFIAARQVGPQGHVIGVDMLPAMLDRARAGAEGVADRLGYRNVEFRHGVLEELPLADASVDVMLSNCVLNLSVHKRRTFRGIYAALRPGGRLVVSDVVCEQDPGPAVRNDDNLVGQCIGGALTQRGLFALLRETGLVGARVLRRFPYRTVGGHPFFSLTFEARRPEPGPRRRAMYRGPLAALVSASGSLLPAGQTVSVAADEVDDLGASVLLFDDAGAVCNLDLGDSACCCAPLAQGGGGACCEAERLTD